MNTTWPTLGYRFTANVDVVAHLTHICAGKLGVVGTTKHLSFAVRVPSLWVYASRDPFYSEAVTRGMFDSFVQDGGAGKYYLG
jgi:hypothetical protein